MIHTSKAALAASAVVLAVALAAGRALADDVIAGGLPVTNVKIDKIEAGEVYYTTESGQSHRTVNDKLALHITGNANLITAEDAYVTQKWSPAVDAYQSVLRSSNIPWLKEYVAARMQKAAEKAGRFDAAVFAWSYLAQVDPTAAGKSKPAPPDAGSAFIKTAEAQLDSDASAARSTEAQQTLLNYELELARYTKDDATITKVAGTLIARGAVTPATVLGLIHADIDGKRYKDAEQKLAKLKGPLPDPALENDRLFCLAEIAYFGAPATEPPTASEDLALDYMRVVANDPTGPLAAVALLRVGELHEKFNDAPTALTIYTQIAKDYKNSPEQKSVVEEAQKSVTRLKAHG